MIVKCRYVKKCYERSWILVPLGAEIRALSVKGALTPNTFILGKVGFMIFLLRGQNRRIICVARQRPEPNGLAWERLES